MREQSRRAHLEEATPPRGRWNCSQLNGISLGCLVQGFCGVARQAATSLEPRRAAVGRRGLRRRHYSTAGLGDLELERPPSAETNLTRLDCGSSGMPCATWRVTLPQSWPCVGGAEEEDQKAAAHGGAPCGTILVSWRCHQPLPESTTAGKCDQGSVGSGQRQANRALEQNTVQKRTHIYTDHIHNDFQQRCKDNGVEKGNCSQTTETIEYPYTENLNFNAHLGPYIKMYTKWMTDRNLKSKTIHLPEECIEAYFCVLFS